MGKSSERFATSANKIITRFEATDIAPNWLATRNFKVDSSGWKVEKSRHGQLFLLNPTQDVAEVLDGAFEGEQYFKNSEAVQRELDRAGKRIPTRDQWEALRANF